MKTVKSTLGVCDKRGILRNAFNTNTLGVKPEDFGTTLAQIGQYAGLEECERLKDELAGRGIATWENLDSPSSIVEPTEPMETMEVDAKSADVAEEERLRELEDEGMTRSDAQGVVEAETLTPAIERPSAVEDAIKTIMEAGGKAPDLSGVNERITEAVGRILANEGSIGSLTYDAEVLDRGMADVRGNVAGLKGDMSDAKEHLADMLDNYDRIKEALDKADPVAKRRVRSALLPSAGMTRIEQTLMTFCKVGDCYRPLKIVGGPGTGKTWAAAKHIKEFEVYELIQGSGGLRHSNTVGGSVVLGGDFVYVRGQVTRCFKAAAAGKTAAILWDEIGRSMDTVTSVLTTALNVRKNGDGINCYVLNTGAPIEGEDGDYYQEEIWAPCHLLAVISTNNDGRGYHTNKPDPAEKDRWREFKFSYDRDETKGILEGILSSMSWDTDWAEKLVNFCDAARVEAMVNSQFDRAPSMRHLCQAIDDAEVYGGDQNIGDQLYENVRTQICGLDSMDEIPKEREELLRRLVTDAGM